MNRPCAEVEMEADVANGTGHGVGRGLGEFGRVR